MQTHQIRPEKLKPETGRSNKLQQDQPVLLYGRLEPRRASRADQQRQMNRLADVVALKEAAPLKPHAGTGEDKAGKSGTRSHSSTLSLCLKDA